MSRDNDEGPEGRVCGDPSGTASGEDVDPGELARLWSPEQLADCERMLDAGLRFAEDVTAIGLWRHAWLRAAGGSEDVER